MNSGQGVLWIILWICLNSELLRYHGVQNFAKNDTENAELASEMLRQQHFLYQRKICTPRISTKFFKRDRTRESLRKSSSSRVRFYFPSIPVLYPRRRRSGLDGDRLPRHNKWGKKRNCVEEKCRVRKHLQEFVEILGCSLSVLWIKSTLSER